MLLLKISKNEKLILNLFISAQNSAKNEDSLSRADSQSPSSLSNQPINDKYAAQSDSDSSTSGKPKSSNSSSTKDKQATKKPQSKSIKPIEPHPTSTTTAIKTENPAKPSGNSLAFSIKNLASSPTNTPASLPKDKPQLVFNGFDPSLLNKINMLNQFKLQSLLPSIEDSIKKQPSSEQIIALANLNKAFLNGSHETKKQNEAISSPDVLDLSLPNRSRLNANNTGNEMYNMMLAKSLNYSNQSTASSSLSPLSSISNLSENAAKTQHPQSDDGKYEPQQGGNKRANQHDENEDEVLNLKQDKSAKRAKLEQSSLDANLLQQFINQKQLNDAASLQNLLLQQQQRQKSLLAQPSFSKPQSELNEQNLAACLLQLANKQQKDYLMNQNMLVANLINSNRAKAAAHNQMSAYAQLLQQQQQQQTASSSGSSSNSSFNEQSGELFGQSKMLEFLNCFKLFSAGGAGPLAGLNANLSALSQLASAGSGLDAHSASSIESSAQQLGLTLSSLTNGGL